jgi:pancreatic triacylglycerol lipase
VNDEVDSIAFDCIHCQWYIYIHKLMAQLGPVNPIFISGFVVVLSVQARSTGSRANWEMVPDADGTLRMIDLNTYEAEPEGHFVGVQDMVFILFTRSNPTVGQVIQLNNAGSLAASNFNPAHPTRFTIHGWNGGAGASPNAMMRNAYLGRGDFNCITVDWGVGAQTANYIAARNRVGEAGQVTAMFINFLEASGGLNINTVSVIGHSLGSHVAGFAGKHTQGRINTIVGTDPAGPLFSIDNPAERMAATDAQYVEAILTNGGTLGLMGHSGDATFFPNGGTSQPGCGIDLTGACAHERSNLFMAESVTSTVSGFLSQRCASMAEVSAGNCTPSGAAMRMGGEPSNFGRGANGVYRGNTNANAPFAQG